MAHFPHIDYGAICGYNDRVVMKIVDNRPNSKLIARWRIIVCEHAILIYIELNDVSNSQMFHHLISDRHEWMNVIPTVPTSYLAKPQPREWVWLNQQGKKTLLSLTLVWHSEQT